MDKKSLDLIHDIEKIAERTDNDRIAVMPIIGMDIEEQKRRISERYKMPFSDIIPALQRANYQDFGESLDRIRANRDKTSRRQG